MSLKGAQTLGKAFEIVRAVSRSPEGATFTDLRTASGQPKATLHRLLKGLLAEGLLRFEAEEHRYHPGYGLLELAGLTWSRLNVRRAAQGVLTRLNRAAGETVHMAVLDGTDVVYIEKIDGMHTVQMTSAIGMRNPAYCTGVGKSLIAFLPPERLDALLAHIRFERFTPNTITTVGGLREHLAQVRGQGFAHDDEEHEIGIRCAAAPVFDHRGEPIASISVSVPSFRCNDDRLRELTDLIMDAAPETTRNCGGCSPEDLSSRGSRKKSDLAAVERA